MPRNLEATNPMRTVCLDFDDTLRAFNGTPVPGSIEAVNSLRGDGVRLLISSARFAPHYGELNRFRVQNVRGWLDAHEIQVDGIEVQVPRAAAYVDDLALCFEGDWPTNLDSVVQTLDPAGRGNLRKRVNVSLDCVWLPTGGPRSGSVEALERCATLGLEVLICAGPFLTPDMTPRTLRDTLRDAGLRFSRVDGEKVAADLYLNPRGIRFDGDWPASLEQIRARLAHPP